MAIEFKEIVNSPLPFVQAELIKAETSGDIVQEYTGLFFGQKTAEGTATPNELIEIFSYGEAAKKFGKTSMLAHAIDSFYKVNKGISHLKVIPLEDVAGAKATATLTITGTATANGTLAVYVCGKDYKVAVLTGDTPTDIGDSLVDLITANETSQVTAVNVAGVITFSSVHIGTYGNTLKLRVNYNLDDETPEGIVFVIIDFNGGTGDPDLETTGIITILEENQFNLIVEPYTDNASLTLIDTAITDNFKATDMLDSFCLVAVNDTVSNLITKSLVFNSPFITIADNYSSLESPMVQMASVMGRVADIASNNPGASYLNEELPGVLPLDQRLKTERKVLAGGGIATFRVQGSSLLMERTVTTQQVDANDISIDIDDTDLRFWLGLSYVRYSFVVAFAQYQGMKLTDDSSKVGAGSKVMDPNTYGEKLKLHYKWLVEEKIVCEDTETFNDSVVVLKDGNRLNSQFEINVINVLLQQAQQIEYRS